MSTKRQRRQAQRDAEYRTQLGHAASEPLPKMLGSGYSPESPDEWKARRGKNPADLHSYRGKRRIRSRGVAPDAPPLPLTVEEQRSVRCPRCTAAKGEPCRNQRGKVVFGGHADRRWRARAVLRRKLVAKLPRDQLLTPEEHAELVARNQRVHDPAYIRRPNQSW